MRLTVFLQEQLQGDALAAEFFVNGRPIGNRPVRCRQRGRFGGRAGQELLLEPDFVEVFGQRPGNLGSGGALEVIPDGADRQAAAAGDLPHREVMFVSESQDLFDGAHG
jgi:hypothetical protein